MKFFMNSLYPYFKIIRPLNCFMAGLSLYIGILITLGIQTLDNNFYLFTIGFITIILISAGGFVVNDIYDLEIDKINQPHRILPSGRISLTAAKLYTALLFLIGLLLSFYALTIKTTNLKLGLLPPFFVTVGIASLTLYAAVLKKLGVVGNLIITALSIIPFIVGGFFINNLARTVFPILLVISVQYSREIIKDVEDVKGDVAASDFMLSLPTIIGIKNTINIGKFFLILTLIFTALPFIDAGFIYFRSWAVVIVAVVMDIIVLYSIFILQGDDERLITEARRVKKYLKIGIAVGLVGLALNPFTQFL